MTKRLTYTVAALCLLNASPGFTENQQGTGVNGTQAGNDINTINVTVTTDQRLILQAQGDNTRIIGSTEAQQNYGELILDQFSDGGQLTPDWGKAEVLLSCYVADVLLYQQQSDTWVQVAALQVATDYCPQ